MEHGDAEAVPASGGRGWDDRAWEVIVFFGLSLVSLVIPAYPNTLLLAVCAFAAAYWWFLPHRLPIVGRRTRCGRSCVRDLFRPWWRCGLAAAAALLLVCSIAAFASELRAPDPNQSLTEAQDEIRRGQEEQATKADLAAIEKRLLDAIQPKQVPQAGESPIRPTLPPELIEQAKVLLARGDREQQALAQIALKNHDRADEIIQKLKSQPLDDAFRILTLEGNNWYDAGEFDKALRPFEQALAIRPEDIWAINNAAITHQQARLGNIADHQARAIALHEDALQRHPNGSPLWAMTQNNLGNAWQGMPTGDRGANLRRAINAFEAALTVYIRDDHPAAWAMTQNNLGAAWSDMPTGDHGANLRRAIKAYEEALEIYTRDAHPARWGIAKNNLGNAWSKMPTGDFEANLRRAIESYEEALTTRTRDVDPVGWSETQNNLGNAWSDMRTGDRVANLRRAIEAYEAALTVRTRDAHPVQWAGTQNNLGNAWRGMRIGDRVANLRRAIEAYEAALEVRTRDAHPTDWAMTQNNLGNAWSDMRTGDLEANLRRAIKAYEAAIIVLTRDADPARWATTQNNLGSAWSKMPTGDRGTNLRRAVEAYEAALTLLTRDAQPFDWARTQYNLAIVCAEMSKVGGEDRCGRLRWAIACSKAALLVLTPEAFPREHEATMRNLGIMRVMYEAAGCGEGEGGVTFEGIAAAE